MLSRLCEPVSDLLARHADWDGHASSVVALLAHGRQASVECQDGRYVPLRSLFGRLAPAQAPALTGKPKIFLVQACRNGEAPALDAVASTFRGEGTGGGAGCDSEDSHSNHVGHPHDDADDYRGSLEEASVWSEASEEDAPDKVLSASDSNLCEPEPRRQLCEEHDFLWGYATTPGSVAYRGALFAAFREVVTEHGLETSWLELLQLTNERLCAWSASRPQGAPLPSMEIRSTCRGRVFAPTDLVSSFAGRSSCDASRVKPPRGLATTEHATDLPEPGFKI